ncbi:probable DNA replication complex GINS protein PSF3 [Pistacia vera]|uniref:probable DNA replication complex GINS protein PSF3 n=1 Tax=Pistacia vera TaxID=55513 RepID=UPI0012633320|nr:probable DNA replication complex GINS protein PSF3 [Pistacia vera]
MRAKQTQASSVRTFELVPVVFHKSANGVKVDPSAGDCVEEGAKVEQPFWLAQELCLRQAVSIIVPACFNQKTRREIQTDAANVDLRSRCPYLYKFGCKIAPMIGDRTIGKMLLSTFRMRYKDFTKAHTMAYAVASKFLMVLTKEDTNLYEAAQHSMATFKKWRIGGLRFQSASVLGGRGNQLSRCFS